MTRLARDLETLQLIAGKMVVEAKGKGFDKGVAVDAFMAGPPFHGRTPVFVGDDVTDEDGISFLCHVRLHELKVSKVI